MLYAAMILQYLQSQLISHPFIPRQSHCFTIIPSFIALPNHCLVRLMVPFFIALCTFLLKYNITAQITYYRYLPIPIQLSLYYTMGLQESKPIKITKSKSNLAEKGNIGQEFGEFITQLSTLACLRTTTASTYEYTSFQKLPFTGHFAALPFCNKISNNYSSIFICYDCSIDKDSAYLCEQCFEKGNHDSHRFSVFLNNNGWGLTFCRCGDEEYFKKKVICQTHLEVPIIKNQLVQKKQISKFAVYFHEAFKILFGLMEKRRANEFSSALFGYLLKMSDNNLYFSKVICEFLLQTNKFDGEGSNLRKFIKMQGMENFGWNQIFRNLSFAKQYKIPLLRQFIHGINQKGTRSSQSVYELIINFAGKVQILNSLAKTQNLTLGVLEKQNDRNPKVDHTAYYNFIIKSGKDNTQIWKCLVRNHLLQQYLKNAHIMNNIIKTLASDEEYVTLILQQFLNMKNGKEQARYILECLMILVPEYFIPSLANKKSKSGRSCVDRLQKDLVNYYRRRFLDIHTHSFQQLLSEDLILILPYFSFGEAIISKLWQQFEKRVDVISKYKEKQVIKQASDNCFQFFTVILTTFMTWDHKVLRDASAFELISFTKDTKLIEKVLIEFFDKNAKLVREQMLSNVDIYTQKQRNLAQGIIKSHLRYNARKGKYYNISKILPNNPYHFTEINIQYSMQFTEWQQFVAKRFFTESFYRLIPKLMRVTQKALMDDIELVKTVSNISVCLCLLNKNQKQEIKQVTRNFIKEIPDVKESIYYVLTRIRDRLELDIDDAEESGKKGTKKVKLDLITEIRDKKYWAIKQKQNKIRQKYLKDAQKLQEDKDEGGQEDFCHICKEQSTPKRRFIYPCNFTRNNVVSTLLKSEVTDLDINICLHQMHEDCFEKERAKGQCPICKFQINCFIPETPLSDQSYTKNWLRNFQNIVTNINMQSGKSFNSDWATIFLTYLIFSKSFKVIMKNTEIQERQRTKVDELILMHYQSQLEKWPDLTKQAIKKADKTVKGQVSRESNLKKVVKTLVFDLVLQSISEEPIKNAKRVQKKFRQMINIIGSSNAQKINEGFAWSRENAVIRQLFDSNVSEEVGQMFKVRELPENAAEYLAKSSIKCPMCSKYQPTTWQCLFCNKISCQNCINPRTHCDFDHKGTVIILHLSDAVYEFYHESRQVEKNSLYRNEFEEGWNRNSNSEGWQARTKDIYNFFDIILHSQTPFKRKDNTNDDSDNEGFNNNRAFGGFASDQGHGGFGSNQVLGGFGNNQVFGGFGSTTQNFPAFSRPALSRPSVKAVASSSLFGQQASRNADDQADEDDGHNQQKQQQAEQQQAEQEQESQQVPVPATFNRFGRNRKRR